MAARTNNDIFTDSSLTLSQQIAESAANAKAAGQQPLTPQQVVALQRSLGTIPQTALQAKAAGTPVATATPAVAVPKPAAVSVPGSPAPLPSPVSSPAPSATTSQTLDNLTSAVDPSRVALTSASAPAPAPTAAAVTPAGSLTPLAGQLTGPQINALTAAANQATQNPDVALLAKGPQAVQDLINKLQAEGAAGTRNPSNVAASVEHLQALLTIGGPTTRTKAQIFADPTTTNAQKIAEMDLNAAAPSAAKAAGVDPLTALRAAEGTSGASDLVLQRLAQAGLPVATTQDNSNPFTGANAPAGGVLNPPNAAVTPPGQPANGGPASTPAIFRPPAPGQELDQVPVAALQNVRQQVQQGGTFLTPQDLANFLNGQPTSGTHPVVTQPADSATPPAAAAAPSAPTAPVIAPHPLTQLAQNTINSVQFPTTNPFTAAQLANGVQGRTPFVSTLPVEDELANLAPQRSSLVAPSNATLTNLFGTFN